ncbi:flagellar biosynthetic protein FliO [Rhodoplanes azumiensis]|uniref:Flagellar biosynthetic protein FliO n=1 Tax=Rhodoplanes azumiensis TaxID=1897628 RepID=A0ABW5AM82_9BRAD
MPLPAKFFIAFVIVLALIGGVAWLVRRFGAGGLGAASARGRQARLGVIEATAVDSRRRLVLVRRDNVEHLIMLGGPTDVVVEANIVRGQPAAPMREAAPPRMEPAGRPAPENGLWAPAVPVAPEPPFRAARGAMIPPIAEELPLQPQAEPGRRETVDRLAGLAAELARNAPPPIVEPRMPEPRILDPRMPEPRTGEPRAPETRMPEPRMPEPRLPEPRMPEARMPEMRGSEARLTEARLTEARLTEARMTEPRMTEPRMPEPRLPEPRAPEPRPAETRRPVPDLRRPPEPRRAPPAVPAASPAEDAQAGDRQLAAMAEQLEAALRRPTGAEPTGGEPLAPPPAPAPPAARSRPALRPPLEPRAPLAGRTLASRPPSPPPAAEPAPPAPPHAASPPPDGAPEPAHATPEPPAPPAPAAAAEPAPAPHHDPAPSGKTAYESLEEEMANLLGRTPGKP